MNGYSSWEIQLIMVHMLESRRQCRRRHDNQVLRVSGLQMAMSIMFIKSYRKSSFYLLDASCVLLNTLFDLHKPLLLIRYSMFLPKYKFAFLPECTFVLAIYKLVLPKYKKMSSRIQACSS